MDEVEIFQLAKALARADGRYVKSPPLGDLTYEEMVRVILEQLGYHL